MKKMTTLKIALFAFISAIICVTGNTILCLDIVSYVAQGMGFASYLFFAIWISQLIHSKSRYGINLVVLFMSFSLSVYSATMFSLYPYGKLFEYYVLFFYLFFMICLISSIIIVGRIIFGSPKQRNYSSTNILPSEKSEHTLWLCKCGKKNSGKFCSDCGAAAPSSQEAPFSDAE